jgi:hypothetical protein
MAAAQNVEDRLLDAPFQVAGSIDQTLVQPEFDGFSELSLTLMQESEPFEESLIVAAYRGLIFRECIEEQRKLSPPLSMHITNIRQPVSELLGQVSDRGHPCVTGRSRANQKYDSTHAALLNPVCRLLCGT